MPDLVDWAWAGGLFEGEGCIATINNTSARYRSSRSRYYRLQLQIDDRDVLERFQRVVGCGRITYGSRPNGRTHGTWMTRNMQEAREVMRHLFPHLGARRQQRWLDALELRAQWEDSKSA